MTWILADSHLAFVSVTIRRYSRRLRRLIVKYAIIISWQQWIKDCGPLREPTSDCFKRLIGLKITLVKQPLIAWKVNSRCFKLYRAYSISFTSSNVGKCFWSWILKDCIKIQGKTEKKFVALCSRPRQNVNLSTFTLWSCNDGEKCTKSFPASRGLSRRGKNERPLLAGKQKAWYPWKVVVLLI